MSENFLKKIRQEKNISQSDLAKEIGVSKQLLSGFEQGRSGISNNVLKKLGKALKVSSEYIITGKSTKIFDKEGKKKLSKAMTDAFAFYGNEFDKETMINVATELYSFMIDFEDLNEDSKDSYLESLKSKMIEGLAAQCFLNRNNKNESKK